MKVMKCRKDLATNLEDKYGPYKNIQVDNQTVQASSSEPVTPFHKTITIVSMSVSQSSSRRPPSSVLVDEGTKNDVSSVLVTPEISIKYSFTISNNSFKHSTFS